MKELEERDFSLGGFLRVSMTAIFLLILSTAAVSPVNQEPINAVSDGDGLGWASPELFPKEGLHVIAGGCCPGLFKMHHFIS